jgi:hypothetical protein
LGAIVAVLGLAIWSLVSWIIQNILMISIILFSIFLLVSLLYVAASENHGAYHDRTDAIIASFIIAVIISVLIMGKMGFFPALKIGGTTMIGILALVLILLVVATIQSLYDDYHHKQKWWFIGALSATIVIGGFMPMTIETVFPGSRTFVESISLSYIQDFLYGSVIGIIFFPSQLGRALYKIFEENDLEITYIRKPREQHQYTTVGYRCGNCGKSLSESVSQCPYCGVRFGSTREQYNGAPPKPTTTKTRNTTPSAGFSMFVLLLLDMLYGVSLFEIRQQLTLFDTMSLVYIFGGAVVNLIIIGIAVLLMKKYTKVRGRIERVSYY